MRFLHVNHRYAPFVGGSERWVQELSESLAHDGHDVSVVTTDAFDLEYFWDRTSTKVEAERNEIIKGVGVERVAVRHLPVSSIGFRGARRLMGEAAVFPVPSALYRLVSGVQPYLPGLEGAMQRTLPSDLVLGTNLGLESLAMRASKLARAQATKFVLTPFIHLGVDGDPVARRYVSMPHQRELMAAADAVIVMTEAEREFVEQYRSGRGGVFVAGAGVDVDEVSGGDGERFRTDVATSGFLVGAIGAMAADKGTIELAQAVIELRRQGHQIELALAGPPLQAFVRWYTGLSDQQREGIHVLGFVSAEMKRDMLAAIDVLALPSRTESFGIVYLEGWANRKPVIGAETPATRELIADGETGLLTPFGDREALAESILRLANNPDECRAFGERGYQSTVQQHTWCHVVERVKMAYSVVLGVDITESVRQ